MIGPLYAFYARRLRRQVIAGPRFAFVTRAKGYRAGTETALPQIGTILDWLPTRLARDSRLVVISRSNSSSASSTDTLAMWMCRRKTQASDVTPA